MNRVKNLGIYSIQAAAFLAGNIAAGQVVYTDIDPDVVLEDGFDIYLLDINQDSIDDFGFLKSSFSFYFSSWSDYIHREDILVGPLDHKNLIAGNTDSHWVGGSDWGTRTYPYALKMNENIGYHLYWYSDFIQVMALKDDWGEGGGLFICSNCNWLNNTMVSLTNGYLGVSFVDTLNLLHYGWIRCDVLDSGSTLIIKDYAYEATPKKSILAGQMPDVEGPGGAVNFQETTLPNTSIYAFAQTVYVHTIPVEGLEISIVNMQGQQVYLGSISNSYTELSVSYLPAGIYQVLLRNRDTFYAKNVLIIE